MSVVVKSSYASLTASIFVWSVNNISPIVCTSYTAPDGSVYSSSGTYTAVLPNSLGCDSTITIFLTINNATSSTLTEVACGTYTAPDGSVYSSSGTYSVTIPNSVGCDSLITLDLTLTEQYNILIQESICSGEELVIGDSTYNSSGIYFNVMQSVNGCDSIITLDLTVSAIYLENIVATICEGATYEIGVAL